MSAFCRACSLYFGSITAFDAHRVGRHKYTYSEGVKRYDVEDGRRCLRSSELLKLGWSTDRGGRWRMPGRPGGVPARSRPDAQMSIDEVRATK